MYNSVIFDTFEKLSWNYLTGFEMNIFYYLFCAFLFILDKIKQSLFSSSEGVSARAAVN